MDLCRYNARIALTISGTCICFNVSIFVSSYLFLWFSHARPCDQVLRPLSILVDIPCARTELQRSASHPHIHHRLTHLPHHTPNWQTSFATWWKLACSHNSLWKHCYTRNSCETLIWLKLRCDEDTRTLSDWISVRVGVSHPARKKRAMAMKNEILKAPDYFLNRLTLKKCSHS